MAQKGFISASPFKVTVNAKQLLKELTVDNDRAMGQTIRNYVAPRLHQNKRDLLKILKLIKSL